MSRFARIWLVATSLVLAVCLNIVAAERKRTADRNEISTQVYLIADLIADTPPKEPDDTAAQASADAVMTFLKSQTGHDSWNDSEAMTFDRQRMALVIRHSAVIHKVVARTLSTMRQEREATVVFQCRVLTGPRSLMADLARSAEGELGRFETEALVKAPRIRTIEPAAVTAQSRESVTIPYEGRQIIVQGTIARDRRTIRIKISEGEDDLQKLVGATQEMTIHDGRSAAFYFEGDRLLPALPPTRETTERIVLLTPRIVVIEEEEELLNTVSTSGRQ